MSGQEGYKEKLKTFERILDGYNDTTGISKIVHNTQVADFATLTHHEIIAFDAEQCSEIAYILSQYASYLQREKNRQTSRIIWAESEMSYLIGKNADNFDKFTKFELMRAKLIVANSAAAVLHEILKHAKSRQSELDQMSYTMNNMAKYMNDLAYAKRGKK